MFGPRFLHQCPRCPNGATFDCLDGCSHWWRCSETASRRLRRSLVHGLSACTHACEPMRGLRSNNGCFLSINLPRPVVPPQNRLLLERLGSGPERMRDILEYLAHEHAWRGHLVILGWFFDPGRLSESDAHKRQTTIQGTTQRRQKWAMVTDWALAATALVCATATEIAWLASKDLFCNQFANTSAAPSRPSATQHEEKQYFDVMFWSTTFTCAHRQEMVSLRSPRLLQEYEIGPNRSHLSPLLTAVLEDTNADCQI